jgi:hypothetical protein
MTRFGAGGSLALVAAGALVVFLFAMADPATGQAEPSDGSLGRLRMMSLEQRRRLSHELRQFESLPRDQQRAIRALSDQVAMLDPEVRERYREVARKYSDWLRSLPESQREALRKGTTTERMARVHELLAKARPADRGPDLDTVLARGSTLNPLSFLDQSHAIRVWLALDTPRRQELEKAAPAERLRRLEELGPTLGVADDRPELRRRADEMVRDWAAGRGPNGAVPFGPGALRKFDPGKAQNKAETLRRMAEARYLSRRPAEPVDPGELARLAEALPSWIRQSFDALPPEAARERLRLIYRDIWPTGTMPADIPPWSSPVDPASRPGSAAPGPRGDGAPPGPPPPGTPGTPF